MRKVEDHCKDYLQHIIPNARPEDFYTTQHHHQFVSIIRREAVDRTVAALSEKGLFVLSVSAGPFALNALAPILSDGISAFCIQGQQLTMIGQQISDITPVAENGEPEARYTVGEGDLAARYLLAYATALTHFVQTSGSLLQESGQQEFRHWQIFTKTLPALLVFFLVVLLINTVVYLDAFQTNQELVHQTSSSTAMLEKLTHLTARSY